MPNEYQYSVLRFVPDIVREESLNVGVLVRGPDSESFDFKLAPRTSRLRAISDNVDKSLVRNFEVQLLRARASREPIGRLGLPSDDAFFALARREFIGNLQFSQPRGIVGENLADVVAHLFSIYVHDAPAPQSPDIAPARARQRLVSTFRRHKLIGPAKVQPDYIVKGQHASWAFDLGYKNHNLNVIRSIAFSGGSEEKNLSRALLYKGMCEEVRAEHHDLEGIAVVDLPAAGKSAPGIEDAEAIMRDANIRVVKSTQVDSFLLEVAADLQLA